MNDRLKRSLSSWLTVCLALLCPVALAACSLSSPTEVEEQPAAAAAFPLAFDKSIYQSYSATYAAQSEFEIRDGQLWGRGDNYFGLLANALPDSGDDGYGGGLNDWVQIAEQVIHVQAREDNLIFLTDQGELYGLGTNADGEMGFSMTEEQRLNAEDFLTDEPRLLLSNVLYASLGSNHVLAIKDDHSLWAWGANANGQLGDGIDRQEIPHGESFEQGPFSWQPHKIMDDVVFCLALHRSSVALQADGSLWTWGDNSFGQIGNGSRGYGLPTISDNIVSTPYKVLERVVAVSLHNGADGQTAADFGDLFAQLDDGSVYAWGETYGSTPVSP